jgi:hypothetical protein
MESKIKKPGSFNPAFFAFWQAGNQGRFSNSVIDEIILDFMIWDVGLS